MKGFTWHGDTVIGDVVHGFKKGGTEVWKTGYF